MDPLIRELEGLHHGLVTAASPSLAFGVEPSNSKPSKTYKTIVRVFETSKNTLFLQAKQRLSVYGTRCHKHMQTRDLLVLAITVCLQVPSLARTVNKRGSRARPLQKRIPMRCGELM